ncbi:Macrolide-specific efflux protein MacA [Moraxella macacae 0408225]|uniref:Macrolide-specific efflux protein MacA n=1 Tax=Moraxella macacae 0408225 TaxID=1230338 RepID=L2F8J0_9GAMM|nr:efflux RND transporter periplasmic adaptor subunit [Moraxella macacae]ELA08788.1 Macrolide-specific efflux protein MacA [Moraxella macacae 0408225]
MLANKKSKKRLIYVVVILLGLSLLAWFFWQKQQPPKLQYLTETVGVADIESTVVAGGQVYAKELIDVGAQATGRVDKLHVSLGQRVKKGDLIADIDATLQRNALKDDEANYKALLAQHDIKKLQLSRMKDELEQQKQGFEAGIVAKMDFIKAKTAFTTAQKELSASLAQLEQAQLKIATAKNNLNYTRIRAPIDGIVVSIVTKQGQTINAMQSSPTIIKLAQIDTVQIKAKFSEADIPKLKTGMKAYFYILGLPNKKFEAVLEDLELAPISSDTHSQAGAVYYYGLLTVPNPNHELFIGMSANVTVAIDKKQQVLTIPTTALGKQLSDNTFEVQVIDDENSPNPVLQTRQITVGLNNKIHAEVISGLKQGEKVVISASDGSVESVEVGL